MEIGTTVKAGEDPDVYAFVTALSLDEYKVNTARCRQFVVCSHRGPSYFQTLPAVGAIRAFLLKKCPKKKKPQLRTVLDNKRTALMLNERMVRAVACTGLVGVHLRFAG